MAHFFMVGGALPSIDYIGHDQIFTGSPGSVSFTIPAATGNSYGVACVCYAGIQRTVATIGGRASTQVASGVNTASSPDVRTNIWIAPLTAGATNIVIPSSAGAEAYLFYVVSNLINGGSPSDNAATSGTGSSLSALSVPQNGVALSTAYLFASSGSPGTVSWSGGVSRDASVSTTAGINGVSYSSASTTRSTAATLNISFSWSGAGAAVAGCGVSFR